MAVKLRRTVSVDVDVELDERVLLEVADRLGPLDRLRLLRKLALASVEDVRTVRAAFPLVDVGVVVKSLQQVLAALTDGDRTGTSA